jgi:hypothetical protein
MGCTSSKPKKQKEQEKNTITGPAPINEREIPQQRTQTQAAAVSTAQHTTPPPEVPRAPIKPRPAPGSYIPNTPITLKVEDLRMRAHTIQATPSLNVQQLYAQIQGKTGVNSSDFAIFFTGRLLPFEENGTIGEFGVTTDSTLDLIIKPK